MNGNDVTVRGVRKLAVGIGVTAALAGVGGCKKDPEKPPAPSAFVSAAPPPAAVPSNGPSGLAEGAHIPTAWPVPVGPRFAIVPGQGIGPIRIGASTQTIERLMEAPCEIKTETACRYIARAVEFVLVNGVTSEIHLHRVERPTTPEPRVFGVFNGRMIEGVTFLMLPSGVKELIGPPLEVKAVKDGGKANTVEVHTYKGMRIEYDRIPNGNVVVGGIVLFKDEGAGKKKP